VVVDCGAIAPPLLESELFGHERGAFSGANQRRLGAFEAAHGGTIFLDEIAELELDLQPKLLRVLERKQVQRVGASQPISVDVRVIAATNRNLQAEVNARRFRSDLYFRLAVLPISLPPLRTRAEDLPLLVEDLLSTMGAADHPASFRLTSIEFLAHVARQPWPGNVRELKNYLERSLALDDAAGPDSPQSDDGLGSDGLPPIDLTKPLKIVREQWTRAGERRYLEALLRASNWNVSQAARTAGVDRVNFYKLLSRCGLRRTI
jgi:transcriptional regulator with GAF, ATPase, and Fis domain